MTAETLDLTIPAISDAERAERLSAAGAAWTQRIQSDVKKAELTYRATGVSEGSVASRITVGNHTFLVDEPQALAGDDVAASPVEYALGALISCQIVVYRLYAHVLNIPFDALEITAEGDLDVRTLLGVEGGPRAGFTGVRLDIKISGPESLERYEELRKAVDVGCPALDIFVNPVPVTGAVRKV